VIEELYDKQTPGIYFSSFVAQELLAGARSREGRKRALTLFVPFERAGRVVTPAHAHWKKTGDLLSQLLRQRPDFKKKIPALVNDCLIALSARSLGATLYTRNVGDFRLLRQLFAFSLVTVD